MFTSIAATGKFAGDDIYISDLTILVKSDFECETDKPLVNS